MFVRKDQVADLHFFYENDTYFEMNKLNFMQ